MKKLRIGILGTRGIPNHYGGFEQFAQYLSAGLHQRGHEVYVYNSSEHPYQEEEWNGVHIIHARDRENSIGTISQFFYDLNCINDSRQRKFDILLHLGYTSNSIWCWRWPKHTINIVNVDGMEWQRSKYNRVTRYFLKWAESLAAKNAQQLVADSSGVQQYFTDTYGKQPAFIPYGADIFNEPDASALVPYDLIPYQYLLVVARMEPENNIEMIIRGYLDAHHQFPLLIIGNTDNKFGNYLRRTYQHAGLRFIGAVYDQTELNNLRYFSSRYFHGHSVGGTNPSLLEAMACGCNIAAHDNIFNQGVLQADADYFSTVEQVTALINSLPDGDLTGKRKVNNLQRIATTYSKEKNIDDYEKLMQSTYMKKAIVRQPEVMEQPVTASTLHQTGETHW